MSFLNIIEEEIKKANSNALINKCSESKCSLNLEGYQSKIIIKGEKIRETENTSICDCIIYIIHSNFIISNVELKSKSIHYDNIVNKFENTTKYTEKFIISVNEKDLENIQYFPIILAKRWDSITKRKFQKYLVIFRGKKYKLILRDCGNKLKNIIARYS
ncbi:MAG: hypothetical protein ACTSPD_11265 [Promethearchaeota archaeon]